MDNTNAGGWPYAARYLIRKGAAFYRPNAQGYTRNKAEAGRYTLAEAKRLTYPNGPDGPRDDLDYVHEDNVPDAPVWLLPFDLAALEAVRREEREACAALADQHRHRALARSDWTDVAGEIECVADAIRARGEEGVR